MTSTASASFWGQTVRNRRRTADIGLCVERAGPRVVDNAVCYTVVFVARGDRRILHGGELWAGNHLLSDIVHRNLAPHLRRLETRPVHRRRVGQDAVQFAGERLSQGIALMTAGRTAVPVVVERRLAVIQPGNLLRPEDLLLGSVINPVRDILMVQLAEAQDARLARVVGIVSRITVSAIGTRSDKAVGYSTRRIDVGIAGATTAALTLGAAVPVALHRSEVKGGINCSAGYAAVDRIERQTDVDGDVLRCRIVCVGTAIA
jgi:hypothetical protein